MSRRCPICRGLGCVDGDVCMACSGRGWIRRDVRCEHHVERNGEVTVCGKPAPWVSAHPVSRFYCDVHMPMGEFHQVVL